MPLYILHWKLNDEALYDKIEVPVPFSATDDYEARGIANKLAEYSREATPRLINLDTGEDVGWCGKTRGDREREAQRERWRAYEAERKARGLDHPYDCRCEPCLAKRESWRKP